MTALLDSPTVLEEIQTEVDLKESSEDDDAVTVESVILATPVVEDTSIVAVPERPIEEPESKRKVPLVKEKVAPPEAT